MTKHEGKTMDADAQDVTPIHKSIAAALARAQSEMGKALKSANNPHFKSKYADLASVADACMPSLTRHGIAVIQPTFDDDTGRYVKTILIHGESGETLECRVPLIVQKNDMQGYGSAVTYARRYGLMGMAGIAPDDDDGQAAAAAPKRDERPPFDAEAAAKRIKGKLAQASDIADLKERWTQEGDVIAEVKSVSADLFAQIEAAKNSRRDAIQQADQTKDAPRASDDLNGDEIPY